MDEIGMRYWWERHWLWPAWGNPAWEQLGKSGSYQIDDCAERNLHLCISQETPQCASQSCVMCAFILFAKIKRHSTTKLDKMEYTGNPSNQVLMGTFIQDECRYSSAVYYAPYAGTLKSTVPATRKYVHGNYLGLSLFIAILCFSHLALSCLARALFSSAFKCYGQI